MSDEKSFLVFRLTFRSLSNVSVMFFSANRLFIHFHCNGIRGRAFSSSPYSIHGQPTAATSGEFCNLLCRAYLKLKNWQRSMRLKYRIKIRFPGFDFNVISMFEKEFKKFKEVYIKVLFMF